jgi:hypothetical protein
MRLVSIVGAVPTVYTANCTFLKANFFAEALLGVAAPVLKLQRARIKTRVFSYFDKFKTF